MKNIATILILLLLAGRSFSQGPDSARYTHYRFAFGSRQPRQWVDTVLIIPKDTIWSKDGLALKDGFFYTGDHVKWTQLSAKTSTDYQHFVLSSDIRDTTFTFSFPCASIGSAYSGPYEFFQLPQYIGFRIRMRSAVQNIPMNFCLYGTWFDWDPTTGNLYYYGVSENDLIIIEAY